MKRRIFVTLEMEVNSNNVKLEIDRKKSQFCHDTRYKADFISPSLALEDIGRELDNGNFYLVRVEDVECGNVMYV